jgi:hypothetical protein
MTRIRPVSWVAFALFLLVGRSLPAADAGLSPDAAYLQLLAGDWIMSGTFAGKPVHYRAHGESVLQGAFIRLHMIDAAATPAYEADVYIGYDAHKNDYILHWLDRFGAAGARVVGTGGRRGSVLTATFRKGKVISVSERITASFRSAVPGLKLRAPKPTEGGHGNRCDDRAGAAHGT